MKSRPIVTPRPIDLQVSLGTAVRAQRQLLGITQEELAWRADMHRSYLADIERGGRNVTLRSVANLARALQVSVVCLLAPLGGGDEAGSSEPDFGEILLVEDNAIDAELAMHAFKRAKILNPIKLVTTGQEALDFLQRGGRYKGRREAVPRLVLLDLHLPDISGLEVLRTIKGKENTRDIPIVVLTGSRLDKDVTLCRRLGAGHYIVKPLDFTGLSEVTARLDLDWTLGPSRQAAG